MSVINDTQALILHAWQETVIGILLYIHGVFLSFCNVCHCLYLVIFFDICIKIIFWAAKLYHKMNKRNFHCHHYCLLLYFLYAMTSFYSKLW